MNKKFIRSISAAAALALSASGVAVGAQPLVPLNTDLKLTAPSSVTIIDQQSPVLDSTGAPVFDSNGNEETNDVTSVNLNLFYVYTDFNTNLLEGIANQGTLRIGVQPAGFCASINEIGMRPANETEPFDVPLGQLRKGPGLPPFLTTYLFQGLTGPEFFLVDQAIAEAENPVLIEPAPEPIPPADSQGGFNGTPYANLTLSLTALNAGELQLDGITDLSELLGVPQGKVDIVVALENQPGSIDQPQVADLLPAATDVACLANVTPTITIVPVGPYYAPTK
jgi:hypothetical protein